MRTSFKRKQILIFDWMDKSLARMSKDAGMTQSEAIRYLIASEILDGGIKIDDKELDELMFKLRKKLDTGK